jgi:photosystem II stability/assembly factor-like uncharacterized protein
MKKNLFFIFILIFLGGYSSNSFSQTGWISQSSGTTVDLSSVFFINENTGFASGGTPSYGVILKTTNGGTNWNICYNNISAVAFSIMFLNSTTGFVAGGYYPVSYVMKTTDCGLTWVTQSTGMPYALFTIYMIDVNTGYSTGDWGHIIKTTNGGTWYALPSCTSDYLECITFPSPNTGYAVGRVGQIIKTTNAGNNWFFLVNYGTWLNSVKFLSDNVGFTVGQNGIILFTENAGTTWSAKTSGTSNTLNVIFFTNSGKGYISGNAGVILSSSNNGQNWGPQFTGTTNNLLSVFFLNDLTGYSVGSNGTIIKTTNGGTSPPSPPTLISPANNSTGISVTPTMTWNTSTGAVNYKIQISTVANFLVITDSATVSSTQYIVPQGKLSNGYTYFWRVNASNLQGTSNWSSIWSFSTTALPPAPTLISPPNGMIGTSTTPTLTWSSLSGLLYYKVQISRVPDFTMIIDTAMSVVSQYTVPSGKLFDNITYFWRVNAINAYGSGPWSTVWSFTPQPNRINLIGNTVPSEFNLYNNYPNPFNPTTKIKFDLPENSNIKLAIFDISGKEILRPFNNNLSAGTYEFIFDAKNLSSGFYFYRLESNKFSDTKKMLLIK